jgi:nitroreductase
VVEDTGEKIMYYNDLMKFRFACKVFDKKKRIANIDLDEILESIRLSPSSFGMEPWRVIVVKDKSLRSQIKEISWNQPQITDASNLLIFTTDIESIKADTQYVKDMFSRRELPQDMYEKYLEVYKNFTESMSECEFEQWAQKQCYIAAANAMNCAASLKIDSCPIEGFDKNALHKLLKLDESRGVALMIAFGYRDMEQSQRVRLDKDEIINYI